MGGRRGTPAETPQSGGAGGSPPHCHWRSRLRYALLLWQLIVPRGLGVHCMGVGVVPRSCIANCHVIHAAAHSCPDAAQNKSEQEYLPCMPFTQLACVSVAHDHDAHVMQASPAYWQRYWGRLIGRGAVSQWQAALVTQLRIPGSRTQPCVTTYLWASPLMRTGQL